MTDYNLGTARGVIEIEYRGDGARQASADLRNAGTSAQDASERSSRAAGQMAKAGAVIAAGLGLATKSAADFEKGLSNIEAVSGATDAEMEKIRDKALQLGKDTQFSASESAAAIEELVKAGVSVADVMAGAADSTVALAAAGEVSMPEAAAIASNAMNQFGLAAKEMPGVADAIAGAANASAIDVSEFGYSLSQVGAVANLAGANFEDTATAIALMGNAGIKGSDAGTSLKSMLNNLQPTTEKQKDLMEELGIVTEDGVNKFYDAEGSLKSLADVSGILSNSLKGMTDQQKQATLETLFGSDAIRAAAVLADNGAQGFDKMTASMGKVKAADVAATKMDNLAGSMEMLQGSVETLMIMIGTPLLNGTRAVVDAITAVLDVVLGLPKPVLAAAAMFASLLSTGLLLAAGILKLRAMFVALRAGALLLSAPILVVVAAIAGLVAAFTYFYRTNAKFRAYVQAMGAVLQKALGDAIEWLVPRLKQFGEFLVEAFQASLPYLKRFGEFLVDVFNRAVAAFQSALPSIQQFGENLVSAFNAMLPTIKSVMAFLGELAGLFMTEVLPVIIEVGKQIWSSLVSAIKSIIPLIPPVISAIGSMVGALVGLVKAIVGSSAFKFLIGVLKVLARVLVGTVIPLLIRVGGVFAKVFVGVIGAAIRTILNVVKGVLGVITGIFKVFTGILTGNWKKAWDGVKDILKGAVGIIGGLLKGLLGAAKSILAGLGDLIVAGVKAIPGLLKGLGGLFLEAGKFIIRSFVNGIKNAAGLISGLAGNIWDFVKGLLNGAIGKINAALEFTINPPGPGSVSVNPPDIPQLAKGGVLTAPTIAWVAEAGEDEAVVPLKQLWKQMDAVYRAGRMQQRDLDLVAASGRSGPSESGRVSGGGNSVTIINPEPERAGQSVSRRVQSAMDEMGWN